MFIFLCFLIITQETTSSGKFSPIFSYLRKMTTLCLLGLGQAVRLLRNNPVATHSQEPQRGPSSAFYLICSSTRTSCTWARHLSSFRFDYFFHSEFTAKPYTASTFKETQTEVDGNDTAFSMWLSAFPATCAVACLAEWSAGAASVLRKHW